mmetsp:Transcript_7578/g.15768  ORF Transcript_7578/g.15768 Transcript_7578/m.15768 type:complete len:253 (+) Transcript_7578:701-1459(+)
MLLVLGLKRQDAGNAVGHVFNFHSEVPNLWRPIMVRVVVVAILGPMEGELLELEIPLQESSGILPSVQLFNQVLRQVALVPVLHIAVHLLLRAHWQVLDMESVLVPMPLMKVTGINDMVRPFLTVAVGFSRGLAATEIVLLLLLVHGFLPLIHLDTALEPEDATLFAHLGKPIVCNRLEPLGDLGVHMHQRAIVVGQFVLANGLHLAPTHADDRLQLRIAPLVDPHQRDGEGDDHNQANDHAPEGIAQPFEP